MASLVWLETAKLSSSHLELRTSSMHIVLGVGEMHASMPTSKSRLRAVHSAGSGTSYQLPAAVLLLSTGASECIHAGES